MKGSLATATNLAPIASVAICMAALERAIKRPPHLPGITIHYGPSGWGKSTAAAFTKNRYRGYYVEAKSSWTRKALLDAILTEMDVVPAKTIYQMTDQVAEQLALSGRPLIVDEVDHIIDRNAIEIVRDIYEGSGAAMLLIGEEQVANKLRRFERFHGRVLHWAPAQPVDLSDAKKLRAFYQNGVEIDDSLLVKIVDVAKGSVRRICVNFELVREAAAVEGKKRIGLKEWGAREFYTGEAPKRKV